MDEPLSDRLDSDAAETVSGARTALSTGPEGSSLPSARGTLANPRDVMRVREIEATRKFIPLAIGLAIAVGIAIPFIDAPLPSQVALAIAFAVGLGGVGRTALVLARRPDSYSLVDEAVFAACCTVAGSCGVFYFGFFSPAPVATSMGMFFFGLSSSFPLALGLYIATAVIHATVMIAIATGAIADYGIMSGAELSTIHQIVIIGLVEVVLLLTFLSARGTHAAMMQAIEEMEAAVREAARREALLLEARRELDRALKVGGPGRFTEQELGGYRLGVLRGRGAMGDIYEASPVGGGDKVAIKLLHRDVMRDGEQVRRFLREARLAGSIEEPNVVRVLDVGDEEAPVPFLVMELLQGHDLASELRSRQRLSPAYVIDMIQQVARGVDAAHRAGIVHRDLKPRNLFRAESPDGLPVWKILDFGVARLIDATATLTKGQAVGTPSYMSPEQARGRECDHRADVFSLGLVAYRALTGRPAYTGREIPQILYDVVHTMPPRPSSVAELPVEVDQVLAIALSKLAKHRFDTAGELADALEAALGGEVSEEHARLADALTAKFPWGQIVA